MKLVSFNILSLAADLWAPSVIANAELDAFSTDPASDKMREIAARKANKALKKYGLNKGQLITDAQCLEQAERLAV